MRSTLPVVVGITALVAIAGCSSSSSGGAQVKTSSPPTTSNSAAGPADPAAATTQITTAWTTFFHSGTKPRVAAQLLENGSKLGAAIRVAGRLQHKQQITEDAKVLNVAFTGPTMATVTYNLLSHGSVLLPNATGQAVLQGGRWKVSQATFCTLVQLGAGGKTVPGC